MRADMRQLTERHYRYSTKLKPCLVTHLVCLETDQPWVPRRLSRAAPSQKCELLDVSLLTFAVARFGRIVIVTGVCVVNFWYDMAYDIRYCYYKFVESLLSVRLHSSLSSPTSAAASESASVTCSCGRSHCTCRTDTIDVAQWYLLLWCLMFKCAKISFL